MSKPKARTPAPKMGARKAKDTAKSPGDTQPNDAAAANAAAMALNGNGTVAALTPANKAAEIAEKIKELVRLAQDQGYLTYGDINDAMPDTLVSPEEFDDIIIKLRNLEVEIV